MYQWKLLDYIIRGTGLILGYWWSLQSLAASGAWWVYSTPHKTETHVPSGNVNIATENGHLEWIYPLKMVKMAIEIVDLPIDSMVIFQFVM